MSCEAFTAMSYSPPDSIPVSPTGANYTCPDNGKLEVIIPENCFTSDISLAIKVSTAEIIIKSKLLTLILLEAKVISLCHQYKARPACTPDSLTRLNTVD